MSSPKRINGRPPLPVELRRLLDPTAEVIETPKFAKRTEADQPPEWFNERQVEKWNFLVGQLRHAGIWNAGVDTDVLATYVVIWEKWLTAEENLRQNGLMLEISETSSTTKGETFVNKTTRVNPAYRVSMQCMKELQILAHSFGFTPAARARINVAALKRMDKNKPQVETRRDNAVRRIFGDTAR